MVATDLLEGPSRRPQWGLPDKADFALAIAHISLDPGSPLPIYEQICFARRAAIIAGDLPTGMVLPTGRDLAKSLGVARNTVGTAYSRLVAEGYLTSNRRRGTRVAYNSLVRSPVSARSAQSQNERFESILQADSPDIGYHARRSLEGSDPESPLAGSAIYAPDPSLYPRITLGRLLNEEFCRPP